MNLCSQSCKRWCVLQWDALLLQHILWALWLASPFISRGSCPRGAAIIITVSPQWSPVSPDKLERTVRVFYLSCLAASATHQPHIIPRWESLVDCVNPYHFWNSCRQFPLLCLQVSWTCALPQEVGTCSMPISTAILHNWKVHEDNSPHSTQHNTWVLSPLTSL